MSDAISYCFGAFGRVALFAMNHGLVRHAHPHCHVLIKVHGSDTSFVVGDRMTPLTDDNAVLIDGWTPHTYLHQPDQPSTTMLALYIEPDWLARFRSNWAASGGAGFFTSNSGLISPGIRHLCTELASAMTYARADVVGHERILEALMVSVIERFVEWRTVGTGVHDTARAGTADWRIRKAVSAIRAMPGSVLNVDELADIAGMSRANFFRRFEASTGVPPRIFQNVIRLEQAVFTTVNTDESIRSISERLGFTSQAQFTRFFRNHAAIAPSQFRNLTRFQGAIV